MYQPTFQDILLARRQIAPYLRPTPLHRYPAIDELVGTQVYIKHENYQPVGAFKVRGGVNLVSQLTPEERERGLIAASTGNHGQSVAYAGMVFGVRARIVVPEGANPGKVAAMRGMGAEVIFHGSSFDEAREYCAAFGREQGYRYVHSGDEPLLIAGVGTYTLEIFQDEPGVEVVIVPVGGGSGAAGTAIAAHAVSSSVRVIGVQSDAAPAAYETWKAREPREVISRTFAEGLATAVPFALPQAIIQGQLDDFVLVSDDDIRAAMRWMIERAHTLAEGAGASALAAAYNLRDQLRGKKVAVVCSGGNTSIEHLRAALAD